MVGIVEIKVGGMLDLHRCRRELMMSPEPYLDLLLLAVTELTVLPLPLLCIGRTERNRWSGLAIKRKLICYDKK